MVGGDGGNVAHCPRPSLTATAAATTTTTTTTVPSPNTTTLATVDGKHTKISHSKSGEVIDGRSEGEKYEKNNLRAAAATC